AVVELYGFVGDARDFSLEQLTGHNLVGSQVEVGKKNEPSAQQWKFRYLRLFDLHDQLGLVPNLFSRFDECGSGDLVGTIREAATETRTFFNQYFVPAGDKPGHTGGSHRNAVLFGFDLFRNADNHKFKVREGLWRVNAERTEYWIIRVLGSCLV